MEQAWIFDRLAVTSEELYAKLGREEEVRALKRLDDQARRLERTAEGPSFEAFVANERAASPALDGRSVFGWEKDPRPPKAAAVTKNTCVMLTEV